METRRECWKARFRSMEFIGLILVFASLTTATGPVPVSRSGLAGIDGFYFYKPYCGHGCFRSFSPFLLPCSQDVSAGGHTTESRAAHDLAICRASSFGYLSSIAYCIHHFCPDRLHASTIEEFWQTEITGDVKVLPKWSYGETLAKIRVPPTEIADISDTSLVLNTTMLTTHKNWEATWITLYYFFRETALESYLGLSLCLTAVFLPAILSWLGYIRFIPSDRIRAYLYPSIIGTYHDRPLPWLLGNAPTVGQSLYIGLVAVLNIVFFSVGYKTAYPKHTFQWYTGRYEELMAYWMWRTGVLAFANMPVLFLFSSRNNFLLWLTNWSHSTYMLLHRWIARLFLLQLLLHSILALVLYIDTGSYSESLKTGWWIWGCVATVSAVILILTSFLIFRQKAYELFLMTHVVMAVICVVGCWYHVWIGYENTFGYETWLYATIAVWFFDRLVRVVRVVNNGVRRAKVTNIGSTIVRVDVPGVRMAALSHCVYVYFPARSPFRPWENHPFSTIPTAMLRKQGSVAVNDSQSDDTEKHPSVAQSKDAKRFTTSGVTLFIRKHVGTTALLSKGNDNGLITLLDGPYPTGQSSSLLKTDRLLLFGGGIGITALLPFLNGHPNIKLMYSVKASDQALVDYLDPVFDDVQDKVIAVGRRLDFDSLLHQEVEIGWNNIGVVVCGPAAMCDAVRTLVAKIGREESHKCTITLEVEAFSW